MRYGIFAVAVLLTASAAAWGQSSLSGKWQTDNVPAVLEAEKNPPAAPEEGGRGRGRGPQAIIFDLTVDNAGKISGTVTEIGNPPVLNIDNGMVNGKIVTWVTQPRGVTWNLEFTDDNTLTLTSRVFAGRGGAAAGRGPGAAPGGEPGGAGGAAGAAPGGDGAPRGGGRGRGPQQPIVLHRVK